MNAHDDPINLPLTQKSEDLLGGQSGPDHDLAGDSKIAGSLEQRLKMQFFHSGSGAVADRG
jgi:hypothetical protein